jgi:hypothetical protein
MGLSRERHTRPVRRGHGPVSNVILGFGAVI